MKDRRTYSRINISKECTLYIHNLELDAHVINISESGILIELDKFKDNIFNKNEALELQYADKTNYNNENHIIIVSGILNRVSYLNNKIRLGIKLSHNNNYEKYIKDLKIDKFLKNKEHYMEGE